MREHQQEGVAVATRLVQQGQLAEATALIQRTPGGALAPLGTPYGPDDADRPSGSPVSGIRRNVAPHEPPAAAFDRGAARPPARSATAPAVS